MQLDSDADDGDDGDDAGTHKKLPYFGRRVHETHAMLRLGFKPKPTTKALRSLTQNVNLQLRMWLWMWMPNSGKQAGQHWRHGSNMLHVATAVNVPVAVAFVVDVAAALLGLEKKKEYKQINLL